ncbi:MAG: substrate-binding domain-containing protein [Actinomycetota bacterium]|nr:substrate-binding domain-containing protein [Actinomycetota bacterium]
MADHHVRTYGRAAPMARQPPPTRSSQPDDGQPAQRPGLVSGAARRRLLGDCWEARVDVPGDLSVVGYDNTPLAEALRPRLSSVDQPRQTMGSLAVHLLAERLGGRTHDRHDVLTPHLVVRDSTAPV